MRNITGRNKSYHHVLIILALLLVVGWVVGTAVAETQTIYTEDTNADGGVRRIVSGANVENWTTIKSGEGNVESISEPSAISAARISTDSLEPNYTAIYRFGESFNTSIIPDDAVITNMIASFFASADTSCTYSASPGIVLATFSPANPAAIDMTDFDTLGTWVPSNNFTCTGWDASARRNFTLTDFSVVNKTGYTSLMLAHKSDLDNTPDAWAASKTDSFASHDTSYNGTARDPFIEITYTIPPVTDFSGTPTYGIAPYLVTFADASTNVPTTWWWDFGDGSASALQNPTHIYASPGNYTVSLISGNIAGNDTETKADYIMVATAPAACPINLQAMYNVTGNGTDESAALQQAFGYADTQASCKVTFPQDATILFSLPLHIGDNVELDGQNATLKIPDGFSNASYTGGNSIIYTGANDWWHNLNYNGNYPGGATESINQNIKLADFVLMEDSRFTNVSNYNVYSYKSADSNWIFRNNHIENISQYGIATGGSNDDGDYSDNVTVTGNTFIGCREVGVKIRGSRNVTVSYNKVYNLQSVGAAASYASGIRIYTADEDVNNVNITSNILDGYGKGSYWAGIISDSTGTHQNSVVMNNTINGSAWGLDLGSGDATSGILATGNTIRNSSQSSAFILGYNQSVTNNIFTQGVLIGNPSGSSAYNLTLRGNLISNGITNTDPLTGSGIALVRNSRNNLIDFNRIITTSATKAGINVNSSSGSVNYTTITNNVITTTSGVCYIDLGNFTTYANNTCNSEMDPVIASFTGVQTIPEVGKKQVVFTDTSTGSTVLSWIWNYTNVTGNNIPTTFSTAQNPTITFPVGNYSIVLNASAAVESNITADNTYFVNVSASDSSSVPIAAFTANATTVCYGATVAFTDQSTNTSSWAWVFGDGGTSTTQSPEHTYNISSGYFTVVMTASNGIGSDTETKTNYINVQGSCSGGGTTPTAHPLSSATASSNIVIALQIVGLGLVIVGGLGIVYMFGSGKPSMAIMVLSIISIIGGACMLLISYAILSPIMNLIS